MSWTVTFSKPVTGVSTSDFSLNTSGITGFPSITGVSGSGTGYTVTATTGTGTPSNSGTEQLRLTNAGSIKDQAGNSLTGVPVSGATYTIDHLAPTVLSINRAGASPTSHGPLTWTVTFSEPVQNVTSSDFGVSTSQIFGHPTVGTVGGSGASYTVSVNTNGATGSNGGQIGLNLTSRGGIQDLVGNALGGFLPFQGQSYNYDTEAPPAPVINNEPSNPTTSTSATFSFADDADNDGDRNGGDQDDLGLAVLWCSLDNAPFAICTSPVSYSGLSQGQHTFRVYAVDLAGNTGPTTSYTWQIHTPPPPTPVITSGPTPAPAGWPSTSATFTFADFGWFGFNYGHDRYDRGDHHDEATATGSRTSAT